MENDVKEKFDEMEKKISILKREIEILKSRNDTYNSSDVNTDNQVILDIPEKIIAKIDKIPTKDLVLISLKITPDQSINELISNLLKLGWVKDSFFTKNFGSSLVNKGLIQKSGIDSKNKDRFSLTLKGKIQTEHLLKKYED